MKIIVTGSAGFIGSAFVRSLAATDARIIGIDDLSRRGAEHALQWLTTNAPNHVFERLDISSASATDDLLRRHADVDVVLHLAAQTAVTSSVTDPRRDFEVNALGTLNLLEGVRRFAPRAAFLFASTNKVYGALEDEPISQHADWYELDRSPDGIEEGHQLDFYSPYGCSKGAADQYVRDYARIYGLRTVVFRQSCIYGPRQYGFEDQGWVAWFAIAAALGAPITVFGDGCQVRDLLWIDDLCELYLQAITHIDRVAGRVYNIGGGPANAVSVREVLRMLENLYGTSLDVSNGPWRPGDQRLFIADTRRITADLGWTTRMSATDGIPRLVKWVRQSTHEIEDVIRTAGTRAPSGPGASVERRA